MPYELFRRGFGYLDYNSNMAVLTAFGSKPEDEASKLHPANKGSRAFANCDPSHLARHDFGQQHSEYRSWEKE